MRQTKLFQTDRSAFLVSQVPADREGRAALLRAQKLAGKLSDVKDMVALATIMDEDDLEFFIELFSKYTKVVQSDGKKPQLSAILADFFSGADGYQDMMQWLAFCMGFNFGPFFAWLLEHGSKIREVLAQGKAEAESNPVAVDETSK